MGDKETFNSRLDSIRLNVGALKEVRVHVPQLRQGMVVGTKPHIIPNEEGKRGSLQVYAAVTTNDGYIGVTEARRGLEIFGKELREDARTNPHKHPNIDLLEKIIAESGDMLRVDVRRSPDAKPVPEHIQYAIGEIVKEHPTPFYVYDFEGINATIREFNEAFSWVPNGFRNYFAVKALPNPAILKLIKENNWGADCSSLPELMLSSMAGMNGREIMFTSNDTPEEEFIEARKLEAIINLDDITYI